MKLRFRSIHEDVPGEKLRQEFKGLWPEFRRWYLSRGESSRPTYFACENALGKHMPEMVEPWLSLLDVLDCGDLEARFLSQYRPPPYMMGCSQAAWTRGEARLVRNYDYHPRQCEGIVLRSQWGTRKTIVSTDCLVGALDGMNEDGLCVSLAFGGRRVVGDGFSAPMLLRYLLETCATVAESEPIMRRIPLHMAYNLLVLDRGGKVATARITPGAETRISRAVASTNHQERVMMPRHARSTATMAREMRLHKLLEDPGRDVESFTDAFLESPLHNTNYAQGFGTLYTSAYDPVKGTAVYRWPGHREQFSFEGFEEKNWTVDATVDSRVSEKQ